MQRKNSIVENVLLSADTKAAIETCRKFGAEIEVKDTSIIAKNSIKTGTKVPEINTENSGATIRIASGIASLFSDEIILAGDSSLQKRPMQPLLDPLSSMEHNVIQQMESRQSKLKEKSLEEM